jgi:NADH-quinone oxidoreductase subunit G
VVQELFETETAKLADVVLPAQAYTEREGTVTSGERRVQRFYPAVPALEGTKADFAITSQVAKQMGVILEGTSASVVFEIMAADNSSFAGLNYARLAETEPQWPIVGRGDMYYGGTTYANKQGLGVQLSNAAQRGEKVGLPRIQKTTVLVRTRRSCWRYPSRNFTIRASPYPLRGCWKKDRRSLCSFASGHR